MLGELTQMWLRGSSLDLELKGIINQILWSFKLNLGNNSYVLVDIHNLEYYIKLKLLKPVLCVICEVGS